MIGATGSQTLWYLTRGTGLVALLLLTASVILGVLTTVRWRSTGWPRFVTAALHGNLSLLAVCFVAVHVITAVVDAYAPIHWLDVFVPLTSPYRPIWIGLGAVAVDLMIAVTVTSLIRERLGYPAWRTVHWASYGCWPVALVHGFGTGTDTRVGWALAVELGCLAAVVLAIWCRLAKAAEATPGQRAAAVTASVVIPLIVLAWLAVGPLRSGWASRAGTPRSLLHRSSPQHNGGR